MKQLLIGPIGTLAVCLYCAVVGTVSSIPYTRKTTRPSYVQLERTHSLKCAHAILFNGIVKKRKFSTVHAL